ncbi:MAG: invasion associated locus B family protein [Magnetococcales bacterium]|nr:invasion associated locus B family protein [Magnetococcales bacterium]
MKMNFLGINMVVLGLLVYIALFIPTMGFTAPQVGDKFGSWTFSCKALGPSNTKCGLTQSIVSRSSRKLILRANLGFIGKKGELLLVLRTPLNLYLKAGVMVKVDSGPKRNMILHQCKKSGCVAMYNVSQSFRNELILGNKLLVKFKLILKEGIVGIPVKINLNGVQKGINELEKSQAGKRYTIIQENDQLPIF